jgi:peptidoglycan/LPS O-acetylase OafA/YrhL
MAYLRASFPSSLDDGLRASKKVLLPILPTYIQHRITCVGDEAPKRRLHSTSALDGLRGIAALFVFFFHILFAYQQFTEYGYGEGEDNMRWIQLPFLSLWYRGHSMVAIFFVVGGYVLSIKPLTLVHSHRQSEAHSALVSSVFRRGLRLYLPAIAVTFLTMLTIYGGFWEYQRQFITEEKEYIFYSDMHPEALLTFKEQFWDWVYATGRLTDLFNYYNRDGYMLPYYNAYDPHLWTVPFEYRSSLIVSMVLLAFSRCTTRVRLFFEACTVLFCGMWDRWELVCFLSGTFICDLDITLRSSSYDSDSDGDEYEEKLPEYREVPLALPTGILRFFENKKRRASNFLRSSVTGTKRWIVFFIAGLYLLSTPNFSIDITPGYRWLFAHLTPSTYSDSKRFLQSLGALLVTWSVANSSSLQRPFNTCFAQYLGQVSYALYIVHGPLIHVVGYSITPNVWIHVTGMGPWGYWIGLGLSSAVLGTCVAIAADLFYRVVDVRSVKISRWVEERCFVKH